ncbi:MAG: GDP-L-fucose synthase [Verrucomicrobiota bacterium]
MNQSPSSTYIAGHTGMVGSALIRRFRQEEHQALITATRQECDLLDQQAVRSFLQEKKPDTIIIAAARVGGIHANSTYPADFLYQNLMIAANLIHQAFEAEIPRVLFLGSSCVYPKFAEQPIQESSLLTSALEPTNEAYAIAKIAGIKLCEFYRQQHGVLYHSAMPSNLYGPGDNYHPENSHVIAALIRRFHEAKEARAEEVTIWGTGTPLREFMHVDDLADASLHLLQLADPPDLVNLGTGEEVTIGDLAKLVKEVVGFEGELTFDPTKPDGTPRKVMDSALLRDTGWEKTHTLATGLRHAYDDFRKGLASDALRQV